MTSADLVTALANFQWLLRNRSEVSFDPTSETVMYGGGGVHMDVLMEAGFTPATSAGHGP